MDRNCVNNGIYFPTESRWHCDVTCTAVSNCGGFLATGTRQGSVILWRIRKKGTKVPKRDPYVRLKASAECSKDVILEPHFMLLASNNPIANPVRRVAFASGFTPVYSLKHEKATQGSSFKEEQKAEDILISLHKDSSVVLWSLLDCRCLHKVKGPPFPIRSICVLPDDRFVALVGHSKLNVIDLWRLKLIGMLEINGKCHFDKSIYSTNPQTGPSAPTVGVFNMDKLSTDTCNLATSSMDRGVYQKPKRILKARCGGVPLEETDRDRRFRTTSSWRYPSNYNVGNDVIFSYPLLLAVLLDNHELVIWDLTEPILTYKKKYDARNGPIALVTHWDRQFQRCSDYYKHEMTEFRNNYASTVKRTSTLAMFMVGGGDTTESTQETRTDLPMMREWIPELEAAGGDVCIVDRYIFVIFGIRILVWLYDVQGQLNRVGELLRMDDSGEVPPDLWYGLQCSRLPGSKTVLIAWAVSGHVSIFDIPDVHEPMKQFRLITTIQYPAFDKRKCFKRNVLAFFPIISSEKTLDMRATARIVPEFYLIKYARDGNMATGGAYSKCWSRICPEVLLSRTLGKTSEGVISTSVVYKEGTLHRVNVMKTGSMHMANLSEGSKVDLVSCTSLSRCLTLLTRECRLKQLVLPGAFLMEWMRSIYQAATCKPQPVRGSIISHCLGGKDLVVCVNSSHLFVYSLASLDLRWAIAHMHSYPVKAIYGVMSLVFSGPKCSDSIFADLEDTFVTVDTAGCIVLVQLENLPEDKQNAEHVNPRIGAHEIYSDGEKSEDEHKGQWSNILDHCSSPAVLRKGIHRMARSKLLCAREIERVATNFGKDLLFVFTCDLILVWRISSGTFLRSLSYLDTYRKAVSISNDFPLGERLKMKSMSTLADTLSSLLMTDWQNSSSGLADEDLYQRYLDNICPNDLSSLSMFQEGCLKKRISPSLHVSFLRLTLAQKHDPGPESPATKHNHKRYLRPRLRNRSYNWPVPFVLRPDTTTSHHRRLRNHKRRNPKHRRNRLYKRKRDNYIHMEPSHAIPLVIFPMKDVLSDCNGTGGSLLPMCANGAACYLGIPPGTVSIPLYHLISTTQESDTEPRALKAMATPTARSIAGDSARQESFTPRNKNTFITTFIKNKVASEPPVEANVYFSTCMLLRQLVSRYHSSPCLKYPWENSADYWLLAHMFLRCTSDEMFSMLHKSLVAVVNRMTSKRILLNVSRALVFLRCRDIPENDLRMTFPEIRVCYCNRLVFSFGKKCGLCLRGSKDPIMICTARSLSSAPWEEEASLLFLVLVATNERISRFCNLVIVGSKRQGFVAYVTSLMLNQILSSDEEAPRKALDYPPSRRIFGPKNFYLDLFTRGFGTRFTLKSIDIYGIVPRQFKRSRINLIARPFYESPQGSKLPSAQFIINTISVYRSNKLDQWFQILTICFSLNPVLVMQIMRWIVQEHRLDKWYTETTIKLILQFATLFRELAVEHLPEMVVIIVRCLDPADSRLRLLMLKPATSALFYLMKTFPMVAFYQNTQRFAVGSTSGHVVIYDLRTATKCRVLGGEMKNVSSLAFSATGEYIAAYYKDEPCLVVWNCSSSGFLGSLLLSSKKEQKVVKLKPVDPAASKGIMDIKIQSKSNREWFLHREDGRGYMISI